MPRSYNPTKVRLRNCFIKGMRADLLINCIRLFETVCKPYFTAQISVIDPVNMINNLNLKAGDAVSFSLDAEVSGTIIAQTMLITSIQTEDNQENKRVTNYTIYCATFGFWRDKDSLVYRSESLVPASAMIQGIHGDYIRDWPLHIHPTIGLIANKEIGGYVVDGKHPFKAIADILDAAIGAGYATGSWLYYLRRVLPGTQNQYIIEPLEHSFRTASRQQQFWEKSTWGAEMEDVFSGGTIPADNAILDSKLVIKDKPGVPGGSRGSQGTLSVWEISKGFLPIGNFSAGGSKYGGKRGGVKNNHQNDERRNPLSTNQAINAVVENSFQAAVKDATNYLVQVPIQSGINVTVGEAVCAVLQPPTGDVFAPSTRPHPFMYVAECKHECYFDHRDIQATSTFRLVEGFTPGGGCTTLPETSQQSTISRAIVTS